MNAEDFDIYTAIFLDDALANGLLVSVSDHVRETAMTTPSESPKPETPLNLGTIVMTPEAKESLSDDDVIEALRRLRWGDYGSVRSKVAASNDAIVAGGMIEPVLGVCVMESGAYIQVDTYIGRYTTVHGRARRGCALSTILSRLSRHRKN